MNNFVGCFTIGLIDNELDVTFPMVVLYPTTTPERAVIACIIFSN